LITGAGSGIGEAMTRLFVAEGASVAAVGRQAERLEKWRDVEGVLPIQADVTTPGDIDRMFEEAEARFRGVSIVCNVAGMHDDCYPLDETTDERWDRVLNVDLKAPFQICRRAITGMVERGSGTILNVGSCYASARGNHGPSYTAAKHGLMGLTLSIAVRYADKGVRCNALNPGPTRTNIMETSGGDLHREAADVIYKVIQAFPGRTLGQPEEVASAALFLCSDESLHINGVILPVDGGLMAN
jgi:NAD(P)-dependent dehydrogenase (short-subunit alcohol dehydrogenase family)